MTDWYVQLRRAVMPDDNVAESHDGMINRATQHRETAAEAESLRTQLKDMTESRNDEHGEADSYADKCEALETQLTAATDRAEACPTADEVVDAALEQFDRHYLGSLHTRPHVCKAIRAQFATRDAAEGECKHLRPYVKEGEDDDGPDHCPYCGQEINDVGACGCTNE